MGHSYHDAFHESDGSLTGVTEFPYDEVDRNLSGAKEIEHLNASDEKAIRAVQKVVSWIFQSGKQNDEGYKVRATIAAWRALPQYHHYTETEMAALLGKYKQSVGRWVTDWKKTFPSDRSPHMKINERVGNKKSNSFGKSQIRNSVGVKEERFRHLFGSVR